MRFSMSIPRLAMAFATSILVVACGTDEPGGPPATAIVSGVVSASTGAVVPGASVRVGSATATTGADGRYELANLAPGTATISTSAAGFVPGVASVSVVVGTNTHDVVLTPA